MATRTASQLVTEARAQISNLTVDQVADELTAGQVVLVDLREPSELAEHGAIAGAVHAPRGMLEFYADPTGASHLPALDQSARTILYCASGGRSALACALLGQLGYGGVAHLDGGLQAWKAAGRPVLAGVAHSSPRSTTSCYPAPTTTTCSAATVSPTSASSASSPCTRTHARWPA
jgi:rhodanese-related sulfurtransferase